MTQVWDALNLTISKGAGPFQTGLEKPKATGVRKPTRVTTVFFTAIWMMWQII
ncbi:hypothetical protein JQW44_16160 [Sulfitobacter pseudonitzschiae]|nr:hypothetical protein [Pseudosulfitobacter pseudonitzschiae]MBM1858065.1 hypothetical protein [Pseudosulfitobacter pseudonitzschiae]MBM1862722.1 hypothetical protein [Pseudosulfitobacter pseudonitzschiae]MBM1916259.1 hypothetical protein [Pseudosulfitobacter pseudonitzschiae]MBM1988732.1 hypothetical protein [Pseudosulfitobacter pseudonitzschiae]